MALTSTIAYCEDQDVFDIYPRIDQFDLKRELSANWSGSGTFYYYNSGVVTRLFKNGVDLGIMEEDFGQVDRPDEWFYITADDTLVINESTGLGGTNPNLDLFEVGDIWEDIIERFRRKASRLIESKLGSTISREILKDREGNYPPSIVQTTALKTAILLISAHNPNHTDLIPLKDEYDDIIGKIQSGRIIMTGHRSDNDSKGIIRPILESNLPYNRAAQSLYPIELKGTYKGSGYELLILYFIGNKEIMPPLKYWVYGKSGTKLGDNLIVEETAINYDYQYLGVDDLYVRFASYVEFDENQYAVGDVLETSAFTTPLSYEIELWGSSINPTVSQVQSIQLTKKDMLWR